MKDLKAELSGVCNWFHLGMILEVPETALLKILMDCRHSDPCRTQVLKMWLERPSNKEEAQDPSWSTLARAVEAVGRESIARRIAKKYCEPHYKKMSSCRCHHYILYAQMHKSWYLKCTWKCTQ